MEESKDIIKNESFNAGKKYRLRKGDKINKLTYLGVRKTIRSKKGLFLCDCGKEIYANVYNVLRNNSPISCGCVKKNGRGKIINKKEDIHPGDVFGKLTVIEKLSSKVTNNRPYKCRCSCGKETFSTKSQLNSGNKKSCGCLSKDLFIRSLDKGEAGFKKVLSSYKKGALYRKISWYLTEDDFRNLTLKKCAYCGSPPSNDAVVRYKKGGIEKIKINVEHSKYTYNGVDRVDNTKGYTIDNVVPCCAKCNRAKRDSSLEEFILWVKTIYSCLESKEFKI